MIRFGRSPLQLADLFAVDKGSPCFPAITSRISAHLSAQDRASLAMSCRCFYWHQQLQAPEDYRLFREPVEFSLDREAVDYVLPRVITREQAREISQQTRHSIPWPPGQHLLINATSITEAEAGAYHINRGNFGVICLGFAEASGDWSAIKVTEGDPSIEEEQRVWQRLSDLPHIVPPVGSHRKISSSGYVTLYQVMQLAGLGSLKEIGLLIQQLADNNFRRELEWLLGKRVLEAVQALHRRGAFHLDIKPANFVVLGDGDPKLTDFGCAKETPDGEVHIHQTQGDLAYFPCERWFATTNFEPDGDLCGASEIDAFSLGLLLWETFRSQSPLFRREDVIAIDAILTQSSRDVREQRLVNFFHEKLAAIPELQEPEPDSFEAVIKGLLSIQPEPRLSIDEALDSPFFSQTPTHSRELEEDRLGRLRQVVQVHSARSVSGSPLNLPTELAGYVSRPELERRIRDTLLDEESPTVVCAGEPGRGKTFLATHVIYDRRIRETYGRLLWFRGADNREQLENQFLILARELGIASAGSTFKAIHEPLIAHLSSYRARYGRRCLLVFDNANAPDALESLLPDEVSILITTRSPDWDQAIPVEPLLNEESRTLVDQLLPAPDPLVSDLCEHYSNIPLLLAQACAYIRKEEISISDFFERLKAAPDLYETPYSLFGVVPDHTMSRLYQLTLERLKETAALDLAALLSWFDADHISRELLDQHPTLEGPTLEEALALLVDYALIHQGDGTHYSMHRAVQGLVRHQVAGRHTPLHTATKMINQHYNQLEQSRPLEAQRTLFSAVLSPSQGMAALAPPIESPLADEYSLLLSNVLRESTASYGAKGFVEAAYYQILRLPGCSEIAVDAVADTACALGHYGDAVQFSRDVIDAHDAPPDRVARAQIRLALIYSQLGRSEEGERCLAEGLELLGEDPEPDMLLRIGTIMNNADRPEIALEYLLGARRAVEGGKSLRQIDLTQCQVEIGIAYIAQRLVQEAKAELGRKDSLDAFLAYPTHLPRFYRAIGHVHLEEENRETALTYFRRALEVSDGLGLHDHLDNIRCVSAIIDLVEGEELNLCLARVMETLERHDPAVVRQLSSAHAVTEFFIRMVSRDAPTTQMREISHRLVRRVRRSSELRQLASDFTRTVSEVRPAIGQALAAGLRERVSAVSAQVAAMPPPAPPQRPPARTAARPPRRDVRRFIDRLCADISRLFS